MNRYGLTEHEKAIWPPKHTKLHIDHWVALEAMVWLIVISTLLYFAAGSLVFINHAEAMSFYEMDDSVQEAEYCYEFLDGKEVSGGTADDIRKHCAQYLETL